MTDVYGRNLDLNLLRVFVAVAESPSVTQAASELYLTQPAVSASLRRLTEAVGAPLFARRGRGLALTARGEQLLALTRTHLHALLHAALAPERFDPSTSDRTFRVGLSDAMESWLLPKLLRALAVSAPRMRLAVLPVQFRTIGEALAQRRVDVAVTVADALGPFVRRRPLLHGGFTCLFDPAHATLGRRPSERAYFAHEHVAVSYNGDLRGIVEDSLKKARRVRCSVPSFGSIGAIVEGSALVATVPDIVAEDVLRERPHLRTAPLPFRLEATAIEMLWPLTSDDDDACCFLRDTIVGLTKR